MRDRFKIAFHKVDRRNWKIKDRQHATCHPVRARGLNAFISNTAEYSSESEQLHINSMKSI